MSWRLRPNVGGTAPVPCMRRNGCGEANDFYVYGNSGQGLWLQMIWRASHGLQLDEFKERFSIAFVQLLAWVTLFMSLSFAIGGTPARKSLSTKLFN